MSEALSTCVLAALHGGDETLADGVGADELRRAAERCAHRIERAIAAQGGQLLQATPTRTLARFANADAAVQAAAIALERIRSLPPLHGMAPPVRIGVHCAPVDNRGAEPAGEGVTEAVRIAGACEAGQALGSAALISQLGSAARHLVARLPQTGQRARGPGGDLHEIGRIEAAAGPALPTLQAQTMRLRLRHRQNVIHIDEARPVVLIGRELGNDIVISDPRASRQHARIERRSEGFMLFDASSNGTFVSADDRPERVVRRASLELRGRGRIGCGFAPGNGEAELLFFDFD
jgi:hypothetical protein